MTSRDTGPITIRQERTADGSGTFIAERDGIRIGELEYSRISDSAIAIDHVVVTPTARGGSVARTLVDAAVTLARREHAGVVPVCRYARLALRHNDEDVITRFGSRQEKPLSSS
jgi:predicted GNAT family acetyltransferase